MASSAGGGGGLAFSCAGACAAPRALHPLVERDARYNPVVRTPGDVAPLRCNSACPSIKGQNITSNIRHGASRAVRRLLACHGYPAGLLWQGSCSSKSLFHHCAILWGDSATLQMGLLLVLQEAAPLREVVQ